ncbi:NADH-quinone oxidoreductase subunit K, partial [Planococcus sp. A6]
MEIVMSVAIGLLFMAAVYLMLSKSLIRIIIGTGLLSHGAHLLLLTMGGLGGTAPPVVADGVTVSDYADP